MGIWIVLLLYVFAYLLISQFVYLSSHLFDFYAFIFEEGMGIWSSVPFILINLFLKRKREWGVSQ